VHLNIIEYVFNAHKSVFRMSEKLPEKLEDVIFKCLQTYNLCLGEVSMKRVLTGFKCFSKESFQSNEPFSLEVFKLSSLQPWRQDIKWDSNHFTSSWNPHSFGVEGELRVIFSDEGMHIRGPINFVKFVQSFVKPHEDPFALILYIVKEIGLLPVNWYDVKEASTFWLQNLSPRYGR